ncbi:unnamed protein product [Owenia fusiformis]|uniref:Uncharacterized protein n=1 Tax=Owenia fusiformis TaxID=6347 RepID=A0A8J1T677_OWEFU|nr:unnamed protein product [Owenia fusiformis]
MPLDDPVKMSYVDQILDYMNDANENNNETIDFSQPCVRKSIRYVYPLFVFLHVLIAIVSVIGNTWLLIIVIRRGFYSDPTFFFLGNLALSDLIKVLFVLPVTVANLLLRNWLFGSFLCFFLPMMQYFPVHATMITHIMIAIDRYRLIVYPVKSRLPAGLCVIAIWLISICAVLPYAVYMKYLDLESVIGPAFKGVGICWVNIERHIEKYMRAMFVAMYALPLAIIAFLYVKVSAEFKSGNDTSVDHIHCSRLQDSGEAMPESRLTWSTSDSDHRLEQDAPSDGSQQPVIKDRDKTNITITHESDDELNIVKEKRTQKYMITMVGLFAVCWCPLEILSIVTHFIYEDFENEGGFIVTYLTFTWFGFLSTSINPILFASWRMSSATKDRLRGYFRLSNRRRSSSHDSYCRNGNTYRPNDTTETSVTN